MTAPDQNLPTGGSAHIPETSWIAGLSRDHLEPLHNLPAGRTIAPLAEGAVQTHGPVLDALMSLPARTSWGSTNPGARPADAAAATGPLPASQMGTRPPAAPDDLLAHQASSSRGEVETQVPTKEILAITEADFLLREIIGRGGQGEVWRAWQTSLSREVAVKRLKGGLLEEFLREAFTTAELDHPNIVPVHELGRVDDNGLLVPILAMKMVRGTPWDRLLEEERGVADFALEPYLTRHLGILVDVCNAVAFAHARGIVHRDLKPAQVMIGAFGEVFLMDWGLALSVADDVPMAPRAGVAKHATRATAPNPCGSPAYMAPEQTESRANNIGVATDIYLLGACLYEIVTGRQPHAASTAYAAFMQAALNEFPPLPPECPEPLRELVHSALETDPADRPASVVRFRDTLTDYLSGAGRIRESRELCRHAEEALALLKKAEEADFESLIALRQQADRALQLWPGNARADALLRDVAALHAAHSIRAGDLTLAAALLRSLPASDARRELLNADLEAKRAQLERSSRNLRVASVLVVGLLLVLFAGTIRWARDREAANQRLEASGKRLEEQRDRAESLLLFMLFDLRKDLEPLGRLDILDRLTRSALEYYSDLPKEDMSSIALRNRGTIFHRMGRVFLTQDQLDEAWNAYIQFHQLAQDLVVAEPDSLILRNDLALSHSNLGDVLLRRGDLDGAVARFRTAYDINADLYRRDPRNPIWRRSLSFEVEKIAHVFRLKAEWKPATELLEEGIELRRALVAGDPADAQNALDLAGALDSLAHIHFMHGRLTQARKLYTEAMGLRVDVLKLDPTNKMRQRLVAVSQFRLGSVEIEDKAWDTAEPLLRQSEETLAALVRHDPTNARWRADLATARRELAELLTNISRAREAAVIIDLARRDAAAMAPRDDEGEPVMEALERAALIAQEADILAAEGDRATAIPRYAEALEILDEAHRRQPTHTQVPNVAAHTLNSLAELLVALGRTEERRRADLDLLAQVDRVPPASRVPPLVDLQARALIRLERLDEAAPLAEALMDQGWKDADELQALLRQARQKAPAAAGQAP